MTHYDLMIFINEFKYISIIYKFKKTHTKKYSVTHISNFKLLKNIDDDQITFY